MKGSTKVANKIFRNFFLWIRSKEFLVFLFFLIVSGAFWGLLAIKEPAEMDLDIVVELVDPPQGVVVTDPGANSLKVTVRDNGYNLIGYYLNKVKPIKIKLATYAKEESKIVVSNSEIIKLLKKNLERSTEILVVKPDKLEVYYNYGETKRVKVVLDKVPPVDDKYFITKLKIIPDSVSVSASQPQFDAIDSVVIRYRPLSDITKNVTMQLPLQKISGVKFVPNMVTLEVNVDTKRDAVIDVPIEAINVPEGVILNISPSRVQVSFVTGVTNAEAISQEDFSVVVDYNDVETGVGQKEIPVKLRSSTALVKRPRLAFDKVEYSIEKR